MSILQKNRWFNRIQVMTRKKKRGRPPKSKNVTIKSTETRTFLGVVLGFTGLLAVLSQSTSGSFFLMIQRLVGIGAIPTGITLILVAFTILGYKSRINNTRTIIGLILLSILISTIAHFTIPAKVALTVAQKGESGGYLGYITSSFLIDAFGNVIGAVVIMLICTVAISLISDITLDQIKESIKTKIKNRKDSNKHKLEIKPEDEGQYIGQIEKDQQELTSNTSSGQTEPEHTKNSMMYKINEKENDDKVTDKDKLTIKYPEWILPPVSLLNKAKPVKSDPEKHQKKADTIEKTLKSFGIQAKVTEISIGPRVVQYALSITIGTKVSRVKSLGNDLALALATPSGSVRIEAPIPGTSLIGIEMPNENPSLVSFTEVVDSDAMKNFKGQLPLLFGRDVSGKVIIKDLVKMPHILIAGATGSGKSICINAFLCGLLMTHSPDFLKLILVDPKMVELPQYNGIPHLLTPVITDVEKVAYSLAWLTTEMQRRFRILNKSGLRNLQQYNDSLSHMALPYIVLVVDEMADIMLTAGLDVEPKIVRLAQMARAVGIHLVLATQRPSVDVLTGLIKANIPARIGLNVATSIDSRVILDMTGVEKLLGNGDMLFKAPDISRPYRIQGTFVSNEEVERITKHIKSQVKELTYNNDVTKPTSLNGKINGTGQIVSEDPLFADSVRTVVTEGKASSSLLQRKLRIGYNRAARLLDELYDMKIVGPQDGSKARSVLISDAEAFLNKKLDDK